MYCFSPLGQIAEKKEFAVADEAVKEILCSL